MKTSRAWWKWFRFALALLALGSGAQAAQAQFGTMLSGSGPVNRSMGGVGTASPLSATGALFWNPATLSGLCASEVDVGAEVIFPNSHVASSVSAGALAPFFPPTNLSGQTGSEHGAMAIPNISLAYLPSDSPWSFGLGIFAVAGFGLDYPGSTSNPLLMAPPPHGVGFGPIYSDYQVLEILPAAALRLTDRLTVAAGPALSMATLRVDPAIFASANDANGDGFPTFPGATHAQTTWGGGFVVGVYYQADTWTVGASVKSPQWFDTFRFNSTDEVGHPRDLKFDLDLPMVVSVGTAYTGIDSLILAGDVRYIDYHNANGYGDTGFTPDGAIRGLGWRSIFAVAVGAQYQLTEEVSLRVGYSWNQNPVPDRLSFINTAAPLVTEHTVSVGASWKVTNSLILSAAYVHAFENSIEGPLVTPTMTIPGTSVRNSASGDGFVLGATVRFGGPCQCAADCPH
jgi:long-chain fatty acid transport protein